jgi:hypothetical protein
MSFDKEVLVSGAGGLGNVLFQIATALVYVEKYNYKLVLDESSHHLHIGTANYTNRKKTKMADDGKIISYQYSIFKKLNYKNCGNIQCKIYRYDYGENIIIPEENDAIIKITGYCQNINLFLEIKEKIMNYLNLLEEVDMNYIKNKYNIKNDAKNIMLGIRICDDFKVMDKINNFSYEKALKQLVTEDEEDYNLIVISDTKENYERMLDFKIKGRLIFIDEDDIMQFNAGLLCQHFILSESTYHYWIALLKNSMDINTKVVCFEDTDITNRKLTLDNWIKIDT